MSTIIDKTHDEIYFGKARADKIEKLEMAIMIFLSILAIAFFLFCWYDSEQHKKEINVAYTPIATKSVSHYGISSEEIKKVFVSKYLTNNEVKIAVVLNNGDVIHVTEPDLNMKMHSPLGIISIILSMICIMILITNQVDWRSIPWTIAYYITGLKKENKYCE